MVLDEDHDPATTKEPSAENVETPGVPFGRIGSARLLLLVLIRGEGEGVGRPCRGSGPPGAGGGGARRGLRLPRPWSDWSVSRLAKTKSELGFAVLGGLGPHFTTAPWMRRSAVRGRAVGRWGHYTKVLGVYGISNNERTYAIGDWRGRSEPAARSSAVLHT